MTPREIVAKSWAITKKERQIRRWGYAAAFAETLLNIKLIIYQVWFLITYLQGNPIGFFTLEATIMEHVPLWFFLTFIIILIILILIEWLFPHLARGAIIGLAAKRHNEEEVKGGLVLAVYNFFPIFAVHEIFFLSRITVVITIISLLLRYAGVVAPLAIGVLLLFFLGSLIIRFFCIFAEEAVVIKKTGIGGSLKASFKLVISYLGQVIFLMLLFFIIVLRIILNLVMVILIPGLVIGIGFLLAMFLSKTLSIIIATILGFVLVGIASYFFAYLAVFKQTIWTITFMELSKLKELDVIEIEK